ncbi:MAG: hypothetical protein C0617_03595 [Desulfuromonas sp.]|uniref:hypothetical protein n=1 Tax=Desulfuromonas sp. TaxID=892 RepID=UPI000CB74DF4|nr:hypothetical protein [Desulfuromonas sp.]PLX85592.1 MAG: hypothetical protein C0617_03595 [Desulfuromonas sp.]
MQNDAAQKIKNELLAIEGGEPTHWAKIGRLLDAIEKTEFWRAEAKSFTEWLRSHASMFGVKEATLWRYLSAGRYIEELEGKYPLFLGRDDLPIEELLGGVSPENIEILSKLSRVAPEDVWGPLVQKVIEGSITRGEIRSLWKTFRPVLEGRTARGKGVSAPKFDSKSERQTGKLTEAMIRNALLKSSGEWTGAGPKEFFTILPDVELKSEAPITLRRAIDFVAIVGKESGVELHGVEVQTGLGPGFWPDAELFTLYCDYLWVAYPSDFGVSTREIPEHVGVLSVGKERVDILRLATTVRKVRVKSGEFAKQILVRILGK